LHAALFADLLTIAIEAPSRMQTIGEFTIATPGGGYIGAFDNNPGPRGPLLLVSTYFDEMKLARHRKDMSDAPLHLVLKKTCSAHSRDYDFHCALYTGVGR
jgi:hypothetical protein